MKRVLSWFVLILCCTAFYYCEYFVWYFVFLIGDKIYGLNEIVFWVLVVLIGSGAIGSIIAAIVYGSHLTVRASQAVWKSAKGTRYLVYGVINTVFYGFLLISYFIGTLRTSSGILFIFAAATMIIFGVVLIILGKNAPSEDGAPPTKREVLQAKLDKLDKAALASTNEKQKKDGDIYFLVIIGLIVFVAIAIVLIAILVNTGNLYSKSDVQEIAAQAARAGYELAVEDYKGEAKELMNSEWLENFNTVKSYIGAYLIEEDSVYFVPTAYEELLLGAKEATGGPRTDLLVDAKEIVRNVYNSAVKYLSDIIYIRDKEGMPSADDHTEDFQEIAEALTK